MLNKFRICDIIRVKCVFICFACVVDRFAMRFAVTLSFGRVCGYASMGPKAITE